LSAKHVKWKWYSGGWDNALASTVSNPANNGVVPAKPPVDPLFQWHHQPFAYYDNYAPFKNGARNPVSAAHLQDENNFFQDLKKESLPAVAFIKALGPDNEHPGYAGLLQGQQHVADLVNAVKHSDYWDNTLIIVTYDEHGGRWDHVTPPVNGIWGDGTRVPGIIIGPLAKRGFVDHTQYDTLSILKTIEERFGLDPLTALDAHATSLTNSLCEESCDSD
jgi:phospholipase C